MIENVVFLDSKTSFNRTFMELKSRNVVSKQGIRKF